MHYYAKFTSLGAAAQEYKHTISEHAGSKPYQVMAVPKDAAGLSLTEQEITKSLNQIPLSSNATDQPSKTMSTRSVVGSRFLVPRRGEDDQKQDDKSCMIS